MINSWIPSHIQVTVHQARDLALKSKSTNSEIYVVVQVDKEKVLTPSIPRHTCPKWNQKYDIPLMSLDSSVNITVRQKSKFTDDHIGHIHIPFTNLSISKKPIQNWYKLGPRPGKISSKVRGDLLVTTSFLAKWNKSGSAQSLDQIDLATLEKRDRMMLRGRSKSDYKGRPKESPKLDNRSTRKGIFSSLRKKNSQVFEDCEDEFVSVSIDGLPPTPPKSEQRKQYDKDVSKDSNLPDFSNPIDIVKSSMFTEATQLEKSGVIDLQRVDPVVRLEAGKRKFKDEHTRGARQSLDSLPIAETSNSIKPVRPTSMFSAPQESPQGLRDKSTSFDSSFEDDYTQPLASTPTRTSTLPERSHTITYRAKSTPRRRERLISGDNSQSSLHNHSNTSIDRDSVTSEYYSASSINNTPNSMPNTNPSPLNDESPSKELSGESADKNGGEKKSSPIKRTLNTETGEVQNNKTSSQRNRRLKRGATIDGSSATSHPSLPRYFRPSGGMTDYYKLRPSNEQGEVVYRGKNSSTGGKKRSNRHSADLAQLMKLNSLSQGGNDGLGNVLPTDTLRQLLGKNQKPIIAENNVGGNERGDNHIDSSLEKGPPVPEELSPPQLTPSEPAKFSTEETSPRKMPKPVPITRFKSEIHETASSTSIGHSSTNDTSSLDSNSDYRDDSATDGPKEVSISVQNPSNSSSRSSTPSQMSPPLSSTDVTRETTPSPELDMVDGPMEMSKETTPKRKPKHTVKLKNVDGRTGFQPISPLPPSIANNKYNTLPVQRHYASAVDLFSLQSQLKEVAKGNNSCYSKRPSSQCSYLYSSATSSGRSSPVIKEEDEGGSTTPLSTPPSATQLAPTSSSAAAKSIPKFTYDSASLPRRKQGGGLRKAITMYQDNKKQVAKQKQHTPLNRMKTIDSSPKSDKTPPNSTGNSPKLKKEKIQESSPSLVKSSLIQQRSFEKQEVLPSEINASTSILTNKGQTLGASFTAAKASGSENTSKSHETQHSIKSQPNSVESTAPGTPLGHFSLPPPPVVQHSYVAGQVSGMLNSDTESLTSKGELSTASSSSLGLRSSSVSDVGSCSENEEELSADVLQGWSKEALIFELLKTRSKLESTKMELEDTKTYLESLLVKVMNNSPDLLLSS